MFEISGFTLRCIAIFAMFCDHIVKGGISLPYLSPWHWLEIIGRLAFPIFAFLTVEGYFYTSNFKRYLKRLLFWALVSELPYDLYAGFFDIDYSSFINTNTGEPISLLTQLFKDQNVIWTLLLGILCIDCIERAKKLTSKWLQFLLSILSIFFFCFLTSFFQCDYPKTGIPMMLIFYFFRRRRWWCFLGQFLLLYELNRSGFGHLFPFFGKEIIITNTQQFAILALIPIWLYKGKQGYHNKKVQMWYYAFYPLHLLFIWYFFKR